MKDVEGKKVHNPKSNQKDQRIFFFVYILYSKKNARLVVGLFLVSHSIFGNEDGQTNN
jgi:hypothetical protein